MQLWATGFNAWNQLQFTGELPAQPRDLQVFELVLQDAKIELLRSSVSATLVRTSSGHRTAGSPDQLMQLYLDDLDRIGCIAIAGNDKLVELESTTVTQYSSLQAYLEDDGQAWSGLEEVKRTAANQTTFTALSTAGTVYTWGDGRYEACLGREVTKESPASRPCAIEDLSDLPDKVIKISSGGYATAALTSGNDCYIWGRHPELSESLSGFPAPLDVDGVDFLDIALGMDHMIALTTDRRVYAAGAGGNGQLGRAEKELKGWKEVKIPLKEEQQVVAVHAGYKNSFVVVDNGI